jgi:hypothetical protein
VLLWIWLMVASSERFSFFSSFLPFFLFCAEGAGSSDSRCSHGYFICSGLIPLFYHIFGGRWGGKWVQCRFSCLYLDRINLFWMTSDIVVNPLAGCYDGFGSALQHFDRSLLFMCGCGRGRKSNRYRISMFSDFQRYRLQSHVVCLAFNSIVHSLFEIYHLWSRCLPRISTSEARHATNYGCFGS